MKNVALFGQMYAGKSTIADALTDAGYHRLSFAGPLKNVAALAYGPINKTEDYATSESVNDWTGIRLKSGRQILQEVGQTIKAVDRDFWLKCFFRDADNYLGVPLVVDDGRFLFEYQALRDSLWLCVGVRTEDSVRWQRAVSLNGREPTPEEKNHESERQVPEILDKCDIIVDGTADAYANVKKILLYARGEHPAHNWYYYDLDGKPFPGICTLCGDLKEPDAA